MSADDSSLDFPFRPSPSLLPFWIFFHAISFPSILDKSLEDVFGFISVLPGAFSAYRYRALKGPPLTAYFKGETMHSGAAEGSVFEQNMYLAEDRIVSTQGIRR